MTDAIVAVTGVDEQAVADAAAGLAAATERFTVRTVGEPSLAAVEDADCVVHVLSGQGADEAAADLAASLAPVVAFGDGGSAAVASLLRTVADFVQRGGDGQYAVLAHRVGVAVDDVTADVDGPADGDAADPSAASRGGDRSGTRRASPSLSTVDEHEYPKELIPQLQSVSRDLMQAPSRESVARVVVRAVETVLGYDCTVVRLYDPEAQVLEPVASGDGVATALGDRPAYGLEEALPGTVFASGEPQVYDDVRTLDDGHDRGAVRAAMCFPVGVHGTLGVGATATGAFDEVDLQVAKLLATNAAAACNRARREQEAREARERIATILDRIEGLVEDTVEVLVEARTREEVERDVCCRLAEADPYTFAWLGQPDVREESLVAAEWAGDADVDVAGESVPMDGTSPAAVAHETGDSQVVDAAATDGRTDWLRAACEAGVESVMAIPLRYTDASYGVLSVYADHEDAFDRREQVVLEALGRAVANAINAIERGRILTADKVIELSVTVEDRDLLFSRLSASTGARIASAGTVTQDDGSLRIFLTATGADGDEVLDALRDDPAVASATRVADHDGERLFDVAVTASLVETLVDHGAVPKGIESERGVVRYTIELPYEADAREVFGIVSDRYESTDLVGYHERERPVRTQQEFRAALADRFTDRQETALRTAYLGGFFEWPRQVDGDELAGGMGISRPTYHQHLRAAEKKVFEELFDPQRDES